MRTWQVTLLGSKTVVILQTTVALILLFASVISKESSPSVPSLSEGVPAMAALNVALAVFETVRLDSYPAVSPSSANLIVSVQLIPFNQVSLTDLWTSASVFAVSILTSHYPKSVLTSVGGTVTALSPSV